MGNYSTKRLCCYDLSKGDGFEALANQNIAISYRDIWGELIEYDARHYSKKKAPDVFRTRYFYRERLSPENAETAGFKYKSPGKRQTGSGFSKLPFFTKATIEAYRKRKQIEVLGFTEGELKAGWVSKHTNVPFVAFYDYQSYVEEYASGEGGSFAGNKSGITEEYNRRKENYIQKGKENC